jgi:Ser/Thr protein kinase RdoA (MazF antagonist)
MKPFETLTSRDQLRRLRQLAVKALQAYEITEPHLTPLRHEDNTTFRIDTTTGERYVLRIHRPSRKTVAEVRSEMIWLAALRQETNLVVPQPVPTREGDLVTVMSVEGVPEPRMCVLLRWIPGRFVDGGLTPAHLERVGAFMAHLQLSAAQFRPPDGFVRGRLDNLYGKPPGISEALARQQVDNPDDEATAIRLVAEVCSTEDGARVELLIKKIRAVQRAIGQGPDTFGLIHGDLHQENYLFHQGQVRAVDFDDCGYGYHLYDMAVTLVNINWRDNAAILRQGFLAGYRRVWPLSSEHEQYLQTFMDLRDLQIMIWAIEMRDHPAFRHRWRAEVKEVLDYIKKIVET